jgi:hypothetical protein
MWQTNVKRPHGRSNACGGMNRKASVTLKLSETGVISGALDAFNRGLWLAGGWHRDANSSISKRLIVMHGMYRNKAQLYGALCGKTRK